MTIELELRLKGEDANEETLLDLIDWLERSGIEVKRKKLPPDEGDMGVYELLDTIFTCVQTFDDFKSFIEYLQTWYGYNNVMICPKLQAISEKLMASDPKMQVMLEKMIKEMKEKFCRD
ncbi:hypothetical protein QUF50_01465 [Thiotrichales bacterium HSG1]|nr:hypothetical protein [Thiotrichales bacterium HSG1]